jgi:hypothetical protein
VNTSPGRSGLIARDTQTTELKTGLRQRTSCYLEERAKKECLTCGVTVTVMYTTGS